MRDFIGLTITKVADKNFCEVVIEKLPDEFRTDTSKDTMDVKGWITWSVFREGFLVESLYMSQHFHINTPELKTGPKKTSDSRSAKDDKKGRKDKPRKK